MKGSSKVPVLLIACLWLAVLCPMAVKADDSSPEVETAKQALLPFWEKTLKDDPETKEFTKTDDPNIYKIDTGILPYKGRVKVLNVVVDRYHPTSDRDQHIMYGGVIETELLDATNQPQDTESFSYKKWQHLNWFNYDAKTLQWFPFSEWSEHLSANSAKLGAGTTYDSYHSEFDFMPFISEISIAIALLFVLLGIKSIADRKRHKRVLDILEKQSQILNEILVVLKK